MSEITSEQILDAVSNMSVMDVCNLVEAMEEKFGVSAAPVAVAGVAAGGDAGAAVEEQTEFNVMLTGFGETKIAVIKVIRTITGLGLKEAKAMVESAPVAVKEDASKSEAEEMVKKLVEAGATAELK